MPKQFTLTDEEYELLCSELVSLYNYHWNDDYIKADDCGSKVLPIIEAMALDVPVESKRRDKDVKENKMGFTTPYLEKQVDALDASVFLAMFFLINRTVMHCEK